MERTILWDNIFCTIYSLKGCRRNLKVSIKRWQCPIYNSTFKSYLIMYELDDRYACFCFFKLFIFISGFSVRSKWEIHRNKHFLRQIKVQGYRCKSIIAILAWRVHKNLRLQSLKGFVPLFFATLLQMRIRFIYFLF